MMCAAMAIGGTGAGANAGDYDRQASLSDGRPVYQDSGGNGKLLYYLSAVKGWTVGTSVGSTAVSMYAIQVRAPISM